MKHGTGFLLRILALAQCAPTFAELSTHPVTGAMTEGWDGPGQGSVTVGWYLGWNNFLLKSRW